VKGDNSLWSFLVTLKNPHGVLAGKFALRAENKQHAIDCDSAYGPVFGFGCISVCDNNNANTGSWTQIGMRDRECACANDTAFSTADASVHKDICDAIHPSIDMFERAMRIGLSVVNRSYFMSVPFSGQGSATPDRITITIDPLVGVRLLQAGIPRGEFTCIINHKGFSISAIEAMLLSSAVGEQLQVDAWARRWAICDPEINSADLSSLQGLFSGMKIVLQKSHQKSLILLSRQLRNIGFEPLFLVLWGDSAVNATATFSSVFAASSRFQVQSISDRSLLSVDALDSLLSSESFLVDSEGALLRLVFKLRHSPFFATSAGNL
jgi:hypothetical protein